MSSFSGGAGDPPWERGIFPPELDRNGDHIPSGHTLVGRDIWSEPLTTSETQIIRNVLVEGDLVTTRKWLSHCLAIFEAQASVSGS